jgi:hypothetical protein
MACLARHLGHRELNGGQRAVLPSAQEVRPPSLVAPPRRQTARADGVVFYRDLHRARLDNRTALSGDVAPTTGGGASTDHISPSPKRSVSPPDNPPSNGLNPAQCGPFVTPHFPGRRDGLCRRCSKLASVPAGAD